MVQVLREEDLALVSGGMEPRGGATGKLAEIEIYAAGWRTPLPTVQLPPKPDIAPVDRREGGGKGGKGGKK